MQVRFLGGEDPLEEGVATHSSILAGESHGQKSLAGYSPRGLKESDTCEATEHTCVHAHTHTHIYIYIKHEILKFCLVLDMCKKVYLLVLVLNF